MRISGITIDEAENYNEVSGLIDEYRIWYRFPKHLKLSTSADAFVAAGLIPAMALGRDLEIDPDIPVSPLLLENCETIQDIFLHWADHFGQPFRRIKITGGKRCPAPELNPVTVSFFSGGVDGTHTFLRHKDEIDFLLFDFCRKWKLCNREQLYFLLSYKPHY